jgi:hypothetical protein
MSCACRNRPVGALGETEAESIARWQAGNFTAADAAWCSANGNMWATVATMGLWLPVWLYQSANTGSLPMHPYVSQNAPSKARVWPCLSADDQKSANDDADKAQAIATAMVGTPGATVTPVAPGAPATPGTSTASPTITTPISSLTQQQMLLGSIGLLIAGLAIARGRKRLQKQAGK